MNSTTKIGINNIVLITLNDKYCLFLRGFFPFLGHFALLVINIARF